MTGAQTTTRRLRIALDAHTIGRQQTGNERYVIELGNALAAREDVEVLAYLDEGRQWPSADGFRPHVRHLRFRQPQLRIPIELPLRARRDQVDLLQVTYVAPPVAGVPIVTVVHDLSFEDMPGVLPLRTRLRLQAMVRMAVGRSAAVLTGSRFTRRRLIEVYGLDPARVHAVPYGVAGRWHPLEAEEIRRRLSGFALPDRFVLFVGAAQPRKNLNRLIEAIAMLRADGFTDLSLVVAGPAVRSVRPRPTSGMADAGWVRRLGYVDDETLRALYGAATAVAYVSLYEGFGLPLLEALACGAIVVASSSTAVPEVAGEAAVLVDPTDTAAIRDGLAAALSDEALRARLRLLGPDQAARFTWSACAAGTIEVYRQVLGALPRRASGD